MSAEFLPGVTPPERDLDPGEPSRHANAGAEVLSARRAATFRDVFDSAILFALDLVVVTWPEARIPLMSRRDSIGALILFHVLFLGYCLLSRKLPRWRARRIAATWSPAERSRFRGI